MIDIVEFKKVGEVENQGQSGTRGRDGESDAIRGALGAWTRVVTVTDTSSHGESHHITSPKALAQAPNSDIWFLEGL